MGDAARLSFASGGSGQSRGEIQLMAAFQTWDVNGDGLISESEMRSILSAIGTPDVDVHGIFTEADTNSDGWVNYEEFVRWLYSSTRPKGLEMLHPFIAADRSTPQAGGKEPVHTTAPSSAPPAFLFPREKAVEADGAVGTSVALFDKLVDWEADLSRSSRAPASRFTRPAPLFIYELCRALHARTRGAYLGALLRGREEWAMLTAREEKVNFFQSLIDFVGSAKGVRVPLTTDEILQGKNVQYTNQLLQLIAMDCPALCASGLPASAHGVHCNCVVRRLREAFAELASGEGCVQGLFRGDEMGGTGDCQASQTSFLLKLADFLAAVTERDPGAAGFSVARCLAGEPGSAEPLLALFAVARDPARRLHWRLGSELAQTKQELREALDEHH